MVWARLDDELLDNPKIVKVGGFGFMLHVAAISWCARNLTDGYIPTEKAATLVNFSRMPYDRENPLALSGVRAPNVHADFCQDPAGRLPAGSQQPAGRMLVQKPTCRGECRLSIGLDPYCVIDALVQAGLWDECDGGYQLHDFLSYNPSKTDVLAKRNRAKESSGKQKAARILPAGSQQPAGRLPSDCQDPAVLPNPDPVNTEKRENPLSPLSVPDTEAQGSPSAPQHLKVPQLTLVPAEEPKRGSREDREKRGTRCPSSVSTDAEAFCRSNGLPPPADPECRSFLDYWCTRPGHKGLSLDWLATYRNRPQKGDGSTGSRQQSASAGKRPGWMAPKQTGVDVPFGNIGTDDDL